MEFVKERTMLLKTLTQTTNGVYVGLSVGSRRSLGRSTIRLILNSECQDS